MKSKEALSQAVGGTQLGPMHNERSRKKAGHHLKSLGLIRVLKYTSVSKDLMGMRSGDLNHFKRKKTIRSTSDKVI